MTIGTDAGLAVVGVPSTQLLEISLFALWIAGQETYEDNPPTDVAEDTDEVQTLGDLSGNSHDLISTIANRKPIFDETDAALNGQAALVYDSNDDQLVSDEAAGTWAFLHDGSGATLFVVVKCGPSDTGGQLFSTNNSIGVHVLRTAGGGQNDALRVVVSNGSGAIFLQTSATDLLQDTDIALIVVRLKSSEANEVEAYINGALVISGNFTGAPSGSDPSATLRLGATSISATTGWTGSIAAAGVLDRYATPRDMAVISHWAINEYHCPVAL